MAALIPEHTPDRTPALDRYERADTVDATCLQRARAIHRRWERAFDRPRDDDTPVAISPAHSLSLEYVGDCSTRSAPNSTPDPSCDTVGEGMDIDRARSGALGVIAELQLWRHSR